MKHHTLKYPRGYSQEEIITREIRKHFQISENENKTYQNLHCAEKAMLKAKFKAVNTYIKKDIEPTN